jgi:putative membrane protein
MGYFLIRLLITALGLLVASAILPGMDIAGPGTLLAAAFLLGLVNALIRPLLIFLTLPLTILTLGLFLLIINAAMLGLVAWFLPGFSLGGPFSAFFGWLIVSMVGWLASRYVGRARD